MASSLSRLASVAERWISLQEDIWKERKASMTKMTEEATKVSTLLEAYAQGPPDKSSTH